MIELIIGSLVSISSGMVYLNREHIINKVKQIRSDDEEEEVSESDWQAPEIKLMLAYESHIINYFTLVKNAGVPNDTILFHYNKEPVTLHQFIAIFVKWSENLYSSKERKENYYILHAHNRLFFSVFIPESVNQLETAYNTLNWQYQNESNSPKSLRANGIKRLLRDNQKIFSMYHHFHHTHNKMIEMKHIESKTQSSNDLIEAFKYTLEGTDVDESLFEQPEPVALPEPEQVEETHDSSALMTVPEIRQNLQHLDVYKHSNISHQSLLRQQLALSDSFRFSTHRIKGENRIHSMNVAYPNKNSGEYSIHPDFVHVQKAHFLHKEPSSSKHLMISVLNDKKKMEERFPHFIEERVPVITSKRLHEIRERSLQKAKDSFFVIYFKNLVYKHKKDDRMLYTAEHISPNTYYFIIYRSHLFYGTFEDISFMIDKFFSIDYNKKQNAIGALAYDEKYRNPEEHIFFVDRIPIDPESN